MTFHYINEFNKEQNEAMENAQKSGKSTNLIDPGGKVQVPNFKNTSYK